MKIQLNTIQVRLIADLMGQFSDGYYENSNSKNKYGKNIGFDFDNNTVEIKVCGLFVDEKDALRFFGKSMLRLAKTFIKKGGAKLNEQFGFGPYTLEEVIAQGATLESMGL